MSEFIYGKSIFGTCGDHVIVYKTDLDYLEAQAKAARSVVARASTAANVGDMGDHLDQLPPPYSFNWKDAAYETILTDVIGDDPDDNVLDGIRLTPEIWEMFLEEMFTDPYTSNRTGQRVFDVTACYDTVAGEPCLAPFATYATHDPAAGIDDIDAAVEALRAAGHTCERDDARIERVFGFVVTERFIVP